jgi:threonine/homoserine/homoserine lactone efflux protein
MPSSSSSLALGALGFVLGWSVAWPPGPINAEIIRRTLASGFWSGYGVGLGASTGDALWAIIVILGAGALLVAPAAHALLGGLSTLLLLLLAALYLRGAWHGLRRWRARSAAPPTPRPESVKKGYLLGLGLALTSPWNLAFWLAVIGRPDTLSAGPRGALIVAAAVLLGTNAWVVLLGAVTARLRFRFAGAAWETVARGVTGLLMLAFALTTIVRLVAG